MAKMEFRSHLTKNCWFCWFIHTDIGSIGVVLVMLRQSTYVIYSTRFALVLNLKSIPSHFRRMCVCSIKYSAQFEISTVFFLFLLLLHCYTFELKCSCLFFVCWARSILTSASVIRRSGVSRSVCTVILCRKLLRTSWNWPRKRNPMGKHFHK